MMMIRRIILPITLMLLPAIAFSQDSDFGMWYSISGKHNIMKSLEMELSASVRTWNVASGISTEFIEAGLEYSLKNHVSVGGAYRLSNEREDNSGYYFRHRWLLDLKGVSRISAISLSYRFRFQGQVKTYIEDTEDETPDFTSRIRLKAEYKTPSFPVNPYAYVEYFFPVFKDNDRMVGKKRVSAGIELKLFHHNSIEAGYIFQRDYLPHLSDMHIISLNYTIKF